MDFLKDWLPLVMTLAQTIYAAATFHRDKPTWSVTSRPVLIMATFTLSCWAAVGFQYLSRPTAPVGGLINYGTVGPNAFQGIGVLNRWTDFKDFKAMLITRTIFGDRDRMTDEWIAKSILYTIDQPVISMVAISNNEMRFAPGQLNYIEFSFVVLPSTIAASQIKSLADVAKMGGKIISSAGQGIPVEKLPDMPAAK
ncbi:MAG: hypothetical protein HZA66_01660 [Rhodopseudomonas palustris]|uniref:Uncharacterized protein n=1 Tax=Rhodopseudomonas palustris TaxID=1076 RepID=A0A933RTW0_RHOPL|nr:hypothetical protein [Rhodopseudomonas palustris]